MSLFARLLAIRLIRDFNRVRQTPRQGCKAVLLLGIALFVASRPDSALGQVLWDGGSGDWYGPWLGSLPGNPIPIPTPTTNWGCEFCYPGAGDSVNIGTLYGGPIGAVGGTVFLNKSTTVAGVSLGVGAFGGLQVSGGTLTTLGLSVGTLGPGSGTLTISGGVANSGFAWLGVSAGTSGATTVSGAASQLNISGSQELLVGRQGKGTLSIQSSGAVTSDNALIGALSGSSGQATVAGVGTQWSDSGVLTIGNSGSGTLTIANGGKVSSAGGIVALNNGLPGPS